MNPESSYNPEIDPLGILTPEEIEEIEQSRNIGKKVEYVENKGINFADITHTDTKLAEAITDPHTRYIPVIGRGITPEHVEILDEVREEAQRENREKKWPGEQEKTEEDLLYIRKAMEIIQLELDRLGVDRKINFSPDQIHILNDEGFKERGYSETVYGSATASLQIAWLSKDKVLREFGKTGFFSVLTHEMIHLAGYLKYYYDAEDNVGQVIRVGYHNYQLGDKEKHYLVGLNEAVVEKMARELADFNNEELGSELGLEEMDLGTRWVAYQKEIEILDSILARIARIKGESVGAVWDRFKRGEFTGDMMHLRDIDNSFGKGSLRVLSLLLGEHEKYDTYSLQYLVGKYFKADSIVDKLTIMSMLFEGEIKEKYDKQTSSIINKHAKILMKEIEVLSSELEQLPPISKSQSA